MNQNTKGLAIIFHSGSYDRLYNGLSIALAALALGRVVRLFFTYWALDYLKRGETKLLTSNTEDEHNRTLLFKSIEKGHMKYIPEVISDAKALGTKIYVCVSSMALLNISRDEMIEEVDESTGISSFLTLSKED